LRARNSAETSIRIEALTRVPRRLLLSSLNLFAATLRTIPVILVAKLCRPRSARDAVPHRTDARLDSLPLVRWPVDWSRVIAHSAYPSGAPSGNSIPAFSASATHLHAGQTSSSNQTSLGCRLQTLGRRSSRIASPSNARLSLIGHPLQVRALHALGFGMIHARAIESARANNSIRASNAMKIVVNRNGVLFQFVVFIVRTHDAPLSLGL
jgi:hypothetical protein